MGRNTLTAAVNNKFTQTFVEKPRSSKFLLDMLGLKVKWRSFTLENSEIIILVHNVAYSEGSR